MIHDAIQLKTASLPGRYARALFEVSVEQKKLPSIVEHILQMRHIHKLNANVMKCLVSEVIEIDTKARIIEDLGEKCGWDQIVVNFFKLLNHHQRWPEFERIWDIFNDMVLINQQKVKVVIDVSKKATQLEEKEFQTTLEKQLGQSVEMIFKERPELLGGFRLKVGSHFIDASLQTQIKQLQHYMLNRS